MASQTKEGDFKLSSEMKKKSELKMELDLTRENFMIVAPYLWKTHVKKRERRKTDALLMEKPEALTRDLSMYLSAIINIPTVLSDTAVILKAITKSSGVLLYMVDIIKNEIFLCPKSRSDKRISWKIRDRSTVAAYVALKQENILLNDPVQESRFQGFDWKGLPLSGVLCAPVIAPASGCFAVLELYRRNGHDYEMKDLNIVTIVNRWMGLAIDQNQQRLFLQKQQSLNNYLLELTQRYFSNPDLLGDMLKDIVNFAKDTITSERGSFFVYDKETDELITDNFEEKLSGNNADVIAQRKKIKIRIHKEREIAGLSLRTGETINIKDAYNDPRFNRETDLKTGFITRSVLCIPVSGRNGTLGVLQLINKLGGFYTTADEKLFEVFGNYCAIGLEYTKLHHELIIQETTHKLYGDIYMAQISTSVTEPDKIISILDTEIPNDFKEFTWYPFPNFIKEMDSYAFWIFNKVINFDPVALSKFIYSVKRGYRKNFYHNFEHAFNVLHSVYCMLIRNEEKFSFCEKAALLLAAFCHDLDHRGTTNSFLELTGSPLVILYDESPLENHHFWFALIILENSDLKTRFSKKEFKEITIYLRELILATDLTNHLRHFTKVKMMIEEMKVFDIETEEEIRFFIRNLMITSADLSGQAKTFEIAKRIVKNVMTEFYDEGEKLQKLGYKPLPAMDIAEIAKVPENQVQFLNLICLRCYDLLQTVLPSTSQLYNLCRDLKDVWQALVKYQTLKP